MRSGPQGQPRDKEQTEPSRPKLGPKSHSRKHQQLEGNSREAVPASVLRTIRCMSRTWLSPIAFTGTATVGGTPRRSQPPAEQPALPRDKQPDAKSSTPVPEALQAAILRPPSSSSGLQPVQTISPLKDATSSHTAAQPEVVSAALEASDTTDAQGLETAYPQPPPMHTVASDEAAAVPNEAAAPQLPEPLADPFALAFPTSLLVAAAPDEPDDEWEDFQAPEEAGEPSSTNNLPGD